MRLLLPLCLSLLAACSSVGERYGAPERPYEQRLQEEFAAADINGDEQISPQELRDGWPYLDVPFETLDSDGNGSLSMAEFRAYAEWQRIANSPPGRRLH